MVEIIDEQVRTAFWDEVAKKEKGLLKNKRILIMSSGKNDAKIGEEASRHIIKLGGQVLIADSNGMFLFDHASGVSAFTRAAEHVDIIIMVNPTQNESDNGMIRSMIAVASTGLEYGDGRDLLPGEPRKVLKSGASKVVVLNPRPNSQYMNFLNEVGGGKHQIGRLQSGAQFLDGIKSIIHQSSA